MLVLLGVVVAGVAAFSVAAARSGTPGCGAPSPEITLPSALRTLGGLDQPFDGSDVRSIQDAAVLAATALYSDLAGVSPGDPVHIAADQGARYDALVVPLTETPADPEAPRRVAGLAAFLRDCSGRAWYDDVDDLLHTDPSILPTGFPVVTRQQAVTTLGTPQPRLVWRRSPFAPLWLDPQSGNSVAAGPPT